MRQPKKYFLQQHFIFSVNKSDFSCNGDLVLEYIFFPLIKLNLHWFSTSLSNMTKILEDIIIIIVCANLFRINH
jgi:hypothetical protein